ncbi:hypothetical protein Q9R19_07335 [Microbacterium sp. ARD32]|uniref:hypothetical protein n=1 Tax=Microbacterium sp. ARD32 TaxID=2962577 RepID=UPI002880D33A|nr:hypothetical protein [Microbacterium sp. ARD32]MDT0157431.1 hypothetical protein [Microbacterium sp. ARD32]
MSTSEENGRTLTRKQLREIRLTGSTPVITDEEAAAAAQPAPVPPKAAEPIRIDPAPATEPPSPHAPLTRRQIRALEHARAEASAAPAEQDAASQDPAEEAPDAEEATAAEAATDAVEATAAEAAPDAEEGAVEDAPGEQSGLVSGVPAFTPGPASAPRFDPAPAGDSDISMFEPPANRPAGRGRIVPELMNRGAVVPSHLDEEDDDLLVVEPTSAGRPEADAERPEPAVEPEPVVEPVPVPKPEPVAESHPVPEPEPGPVPVPEPEPEAAPEPRPAATAKPAADSDQSDARPTVGAAFGIGVKADRHDPAAKAPFDALLEGTTSGSQHGAPTALIFTPSPGAGSLSGPITSTGEMLITGTYALPEGLGSQGHARGTTDGRDVDAVLLDGELAPASSPTPIAASAAVSTSRPAGEVIRPPAPDKGNKLMLTLAVVAGGLAIVLATTLVIAFTTGVLG